MAIDEAHELLQFGHGTDDLSFFDKFRRALKMIPKSTGFFSILADSLSCLSDFDPTARGAPSNRINNDNEAKLFPPIYALSTFDMNVDPDPPTKWQELQSPLRLFGYGYPFWRPYADDAQKAGLWNASGRLATESQAIALLGPTIQPQMWGASHLNAELVSNHGASCMYIDSSRGMFISLYPSQITFAASANDLDSINFSDYLQSDLTAALDEKNITFSGIHVQDPKEDDDLADILSTGHPMMQKSNSKNQTRTCSYFSLRDEREESRHIRPTKSNRRIPKPEKIITIPDGDLSKEECQRRISFASMAWILPLFKSRSYQVFGGLIGYSSSFSFNQYA
ncbi:hypothetical protein KEM48_014322 [Puccinia striiformis f. sp. tritici PST-130]|nr:hypothetical protein KEM48_014322 [Puccinia striiformis f. sp. tritici PST-130]